MADSLYEAYLASLSDEEIEAKAQPVPGGWL